jgi:hypothetical protein
MLHLSLISHSWDLFQETDLFSRNQIQSDVRKQEQNIPDNLKNIISLNIIAFVPERNLV